MRTAAVAWVIHAVLLRTDYRRTIGADRSENRLSLSSFHSCSPNRCNTHVFLLTETLTVRFHFAWLWRQNVIPLLLTQNMTEQFQFDGRKVSKCHICYLLKIWLLRVTAPCCRLQNVIIFYLLRQWLLGFIALDCWYQNVISLLLTQNMTAGCHCAWLSATNVMFYLLRRWLLCSNALDYCCRNVTSSFLLEL